LKDYKVYHQYIPTKDSSNIVKNTETTGSGELPFSTTIEMVFEYIGEEKTAAEIEEIFKNKYPLQYLQVKKKFDKKIRKLLKANEEANF